MTKSRVLVVDDSLTIRAIIEKIFASEQDLQMVGAAGDAREAQAMIEELRPDVITLDIAMPGIDGLTFLTGLMAHAPLPVVMVSSSTAEGAEAGREAMERGAVACFNKANILSQSKAFVKVIRAAARKKPELSCGLARH